MDEKGRNRKQANTRGEENKEAGMMKQRSQNWKNWREGGMEIAGEDEEEEESLEEKIGNIELAKTLEQGEETQKTLEIQRLEEKELEEALEKAEKQERKEEEGLQDEEKIAMEFRETGGEHCWSCVPMQSAEA